MNLLDKITQEINEQSTLNWNLGDVIPVKSAKDAKSGSCKGGSCQKQRAKVPGKKIEKPSEKKPGEGKPGEGKPGEGKPGEGKPGEKKPGEGKPGEGKPDSDQTKKVAGEEGTSVGKGMKIDKTPEKTPAGGSDVSKPGEWMDDHSKIDKSDGTGNSIINKVYEETRVEYGRMKKRKEVIGSESGSLIKQVEDFLKEEFNLSSILSRIGTFKRKLSEKIKKSQSYSTAIFNPVTQQSSIVAKGKIKETKIDTKSAIMFFAADTSGSITGEDYKSIFGYINNIAKQFKKKEHGIDGEVYLIEWDTEVHAPIKKWEYISEIKPKKDLTDEEREKLKLRGHGGTDINSLFNFLDENFVSVIGDNNYFTFSDKLPVIAGEKEERVEKKTGTAIGMPEKSTEKVEVQVRQKLGSRKKDYVEPSWSKGDNLIPQGMIKLKEGGFANVPFLIIYTDGFFAPPNIASSKLFGANPGNVLYIVTNRDGIANVRPKNYILHQLRS